jgi:Holliday junction resolvase RusA-like endonuclease
VIRFSVRGIPKAQPRPKAFARNIGGKMMARVYDPGTAEAWKATIALAARDHIPTLPIIGAVKLEVQFWLPRPEGHFRGNRDLKPSAPHYHLTKPDCDNLVKAVMDCLTILGFWHDDKQVVEQHVIKDYGPCPGAEIVIKPLEDANA